MIHIFGSCDHLEGRGTSRGIIEDVNPVRVPRGVAGEVYATRGEGLGDQVLAILDDQERCIITFTDIVDD